MQVLRGASSSALRNAQASFRSSTALTIALDRSRSSYAAHDRTLPSSPIYARGLSSQPDLHTRGKIPFPLSVLNAERIATTWKLLSAVTTRLRRVHSRFAETRYGRLMRLDKPVGTHLLFLPGAWGIAIGASSIPDIVGLTGLFYAGAVLLRGAGCTINDIWDADVDRQVERTKTRPIASGEISTPNAFVFLGAQLLGGLVVLTHLNTECFLLGTASIIPVLFYPLAKQSTPYPQAVLGLTFNWGALMGYCAATGTIQAPAVMLYGAGWCWTMVYDTLYAHQDKEDDQKAGVHSTALTFGENTKPILMAFTAAKLAALCGAGLVADLSLPYYMGVTVSAVHLGYQVVATDLSKPEQCQQAFANSEITGAITWASILAGRVF